MQTFPMFLKLAGRRVVIAGGGEQAAQKARLMLKTEAAITVAAPALDPELAALAAAGRVRHHPALPARTELAGAALAFVATGCPETDAAIAAEARAAGVLVNVVDAPELCDAFTPSLVDRDPVVVAIGTEGTAPVLARQIKTRIEAMLEPRLGDFAALAGRLRAEVAARIAADRRRDFWDWAFAGAPRALHSRGEEGGAARLLKQAIAARAAPEAEAGFVSLVGAGPGARDLITLRGVQRLQEADVVFYDRLVDPDLLELARRDAARVFVGKTPGAHEWRQDRINGVLVAAARQGKRVVRLKCGDPGIFARGAEEAAALDAAGIAWEIVPGVTSACAAAAQARAFLTERGRTDTLVFCTGQVRSGDALPDWARHAVPGATLAFYMATDSGADLQTALLAAGVPGTTRVEVVSHAAMPSARVLGVALGELAAVLSTEKGLNPAILLVRVPKRAAVTEARRKTGACSANRTGHHGLSDPLRLLI
jgi:uroporphyrin-III C-methyltransferase/precorrin-2 dehydrogenase/sirohydrochlorin ferrochelatase